jgi:hypothetical protein
MYTDILGRWSNPTQHQRSAAQALTIARERSRTSHVSAAK